jgi:GT2 family glycosyltransferase
VAASFTIAIPTHDRRETALLAARSALSQSRPPVEVLVLCDGCTDGTAAAVRALGEPRLSAIDLPKATGYAYGHRNVALERAQGDAILWLGDDDLLLPEHLERVGERWDAGDVDLVTAPAGSVHPDERIEWIGEDWSAQRNRELLGRRNTNVMASVTLSVRLAREIGGWDAAQPRWGDWDLWKRALAAGGRPAATGDVTVLHFYGSGREQSWRDRVRQNTAWFERLANPDELALLRRRLARLRDEHDAELLALLSEREGQLARIHATMWWRLRVRLARLGKRRRARAGG